MSFMTLPDIPYIWHWSGSLKTTAFLMKFIIQFLNRRKKRSVFYRHVIINPNNSMGVSPLEIIQIPFRYWDLPGFSSTYIQFSDNIYWYLWNHNRPPFIGFLSNTIWSKPNELEEITTQRSSPQPLPRTQKRLLASSTIIYLIFFMTASNLIKHETVINSKVFQKIEKHKAVETEKTKSIWLFLETMPSVPKIRTRREQNMKKMSKKSLFQI